MEHSLKYLKPINTEKENKSTDYGDMQWIKNFSKSN